MNTDFLFKIIGDTDVLGQIARCLAPTQDLSSGFAASGISNTEAPENRT